VFSAIRVFFRKDTGQDLAEYCMITAFIALIGLAIFVAMSGGMKDLWGTANSTLASGSSASGTASTGGGATSSPNGH